MLLWLKFMFGCIIIVIICFYVGSRFGVVKVLWWIVSVVVVVAGVVICRLLVSDVLLLGIGILVLIM